MSHIKGGGRVSLSEVAEDFLIDCLMRRRKCWPTDPSKHDVKRERKRFVKRLVETYDRQQAHTQVNPLEIADESSFPTNSPIALLEPTGKVRVELVEAIYSKSKSSFKTGAKKTIVVARNTPVPEVLLQAQSKLRMKKPVRVFVVSGKSKQEVELETNMAGIPDGSILYVSSTSIAKKETTESSSSSREQTIENQTYSDPLDAVKKAYSKQRQERRRAPPGVSLPAPHPTFSNHFQSLPPLTETAFALPAAHSRLDILQAVQDHRVVVICGTTGCGKSTQVPQFLWQALKASQATHSHIIVTQPRRVAATTLARRVSQEMETPLPGKHGSLVGHHVRLDRAVAETAQIVYCTVGILLRQLTSPSASSLCDVTHVIVDEVHERDVQTDFLLTLLRAVLPRNPQLRVILMSATASTDLFVQYFGAYQPVVLTIPGRTFPVETKWLAECQRLASKSIEYYKEQLDDSESRTESGIALSPRATNCIDNSFIQSLIASIIRQQQANGELSSSNNNKRRNGAILVFLPGKPEIEALFQRLTRPNSLPLPKNSIQLCKLHSGVSRSSQQSTFDPAPSDTVKIILATNIAETSITIPDVSHVIDTGRVKESRYNPTTRIKELVTVWTSQASAHQRAGRAGRTNAGVCYKLYSEQFFQRSLPLQTSPEMVRTPLDELILQLCLLYEQRRDEQNDKADFPKGANPSYFFSQVPEPPPPVSLEQACRHLLDVDALHLVEAEPSKLYRLTPLGFHLSRLPMDAKVGKTLIVGCVLGCLEGALTLAATLSHTKSCFYYKFGTKDYEMAVAARARLIENGFGGKDWRGGTVKGDLIVVIACYREWAKRSSDKDRFEFACKNALDHVVLKEMEELRGQYLDVLVDAGFIASRSTKGQPQNEFQDDAYLTSCCLVAGLYPNVCTLMRPRKGGPKGGRLLTKEGDICCPQMQSFQRERIKKSAETGKDVYAVYHSKHRNLGTGGRPSEVTLSEVNFVSRYALILFSGELEIVKNAIILDGWLKFKIGEKSMVGAVLMLALRQELDALLLHQISYGNMDPVEDSTSREKDEIKELMTVVRQLLAEE